MWSGDLTVRPDDGVFLVSIPPEAIATRVGKGKTSRRQLALLKKTIRAKLGIEVEFLVEASTEQRRLEEGLFQILRKRWPHLIEECLLPLREGQIADVWLRLREGALAEAAIRETIKDTVRTFLSLYQVTLGALNWDSEEKDPPSIAAILRVVKTLSPVNRSVIQDALVGADFLVPSPEWLDHKLDLLRRRGMLLRKEDGAYVLTESGLVLVPHGAYRLSSDIERALALARKKW
jgi:hypothetical protein